MKEIIPKHRTIFLAKTTAAQIEVALSYHRVRGQNFLAVVFATIINPAANLVQKEKPI